MQKFTQKPANYLLMLLHTTRSFKMSEQNLKPTFSTKQAANYLSISEISLRASRSSGLLGSQKAPTFRKVGSKVIYLKTDLDNWIQSLPVFINTSQANLAKRQDSCGDSEAELSLELEGNK